MKHTLLISAAIVVGCAVIALALYRIQLDKSHSIEKQQAAENVRADLAMKQSDCESLSSGVKKKWYNVVGVVYDNDFWKECVVTYTNTKTGEIQTSPLRFLSDVK